MKKKFSDYQQYLIALLLGILVYSGVSLYGGASTGDDTFIYMRYVENALHGAGFVYNPGEHSHGVTSSLWPFLMTLVSLVFGNTVETWKLASTLLTGMAAALLYLTLQRNTANMFWAIFLMSIVVLEPHSLRWNSSGMENGFVFFTLALLLCFWPGVQENATREKPLGRSCIGLGIIAGMLPFARPELAVFSLGLVLSLLVISPSRYSLYFLGGAYCCSLLLCGFLTWAAFGSLLPQTAEAKASFLKQADPFYGLLKTLQVIISGSLGCLILVVTIKSRRKHVQAWRIVSLFALLIFIGYLSYVNQVISSRYASYLNVPIMLTAVLLVASKISEKQFPVTWIKICLGIQLILSGSVLYTVFPVTRVSEAEEIKKVADFLVETTPSDGRVALSEIGALGFYSQRYIVDLFGLTDPATLTWKRRNGRPQNLEQFEKLLMYRQAAYYIDTGANNSFLTGKDIVFEPVGDKFPVKRSIFFHGKYLFSQWQIYRIRYGHNE